MSVNWLSGKRFMSNQEVISAVDRHFEELYVSIYKYYIIKTEHRYKYVLGFLVTMMTMLRNKPKNCKKGFFVVTIGT